MSPDDYYPARPKLRLITEFSDKQYPHTSFVPITDPYDPTSRAKCKEKILTALHYSSAEDSKVVETNSGFQVYFKKIFDNSNFSALYPYNLRNELTANQYIKGDYNFFNSEEAGEIAMYFREAAEKAGLKDHIKIETDGSTLIVAGSPVGYFITWYNIPQSRRDVMEYYAKLPSARLA